MGRQSSDIRQSLHLLVLEIEQVGQNRLWLLAALCRGRKRVSSGKPFFPACRSRPNLCSSMLSAERLAAIIPPGKVDFAAYSLGPREMLASPPPTLLPFTLRATHGGHSVLSKPDVSQHVCDGLSYEGVGG
jgi:hypothetical protein